MITTIQLDSNVKRLLDNMKETGKETYEEVIVTMMKQLEKQKRKKQELLIAGYKEMSEESLKISKEFEALEDLEEWKW
ncbi:MAG: hypothetical protein IIA87_05530 [Nanoarchaeota archaeon]|nr:hypothetical protein [Nanoarchaeota archaeon]